MTDCTRESGIAAYDNRNDPRFVRCGHENDSVYCFWCGIERRKRKQG